VLATLVAVALFTSLGLWQWHRGEHRSQQWAAFARSDLPPIAATADALDRLDRFTRVSISGRWDTDRQILLDNISREGRPGYEVLTLLRLADGTGILVNRGWLPFTGTRAQLPDVSFTSSTDAGAKLGLVTGRLSVLPVTGLQSGRQAPALTGPWPRVTSFPAQAELSALLGLRLRSPVLLLDETSGPGYLRQWRPPGVSPDRNFSYAIQWWSFGVLAVCLFLGLNLKKRHD
jgi:surfeit locus 1 family protein